MITRLNLHVRLKFPEESNPPIFPILVRTPFVTSFVKSLSVYPNAKLCAFTNTSAHLFRQCAPKHILLK